MLMFVRILAGHDDFICLKFLIHMVRCNAMTVFNHTPVCPGASPVMDISCVYNS